MSGRHARILPFGAGIRDDGQTRFRFWAPAQETVSVAVEGGPIVPMARSPEGWFEAIAHMPGRYALPLSAGGWDIGAGSRVACAGDRCA